MKKIISVKQLLLFCSVLLAIMLSSCHKEGLGGNSSISGTVYHHSKPIPQCIVYIKFNAKEFPGDSPSLYDASVTADSKGEYIFSKVYKGDYYLYGVGYDDAIKQVVRGGIHVVAKRNGIVKQDVPVTED